MRAVASPIFLSSWPSTSPERLRQRLIDMDTPKLTFEAKDKLHNDGTMSQSHRIFDSTRSAIIAVYLSNDNAGASPETRRQRFCLGKSGPPTHQGRLRLKILGM